MLASSSKTSYREVPAPDANVANLYPYPYRRVRLEKSHFPADFILRASLPLVGRSHCGPTISRMVRRTTQDLYWCFDGYSIFGSLGHGSKINQQFLSFDEQEDRLAKQHQV